MATCPYCHTDKSIFAPVCNECNHHTPFLFQVGFQVLWVTLPLVFFVLFITFMAEILLH